ncbi:ZIP family metal transporter [Mycoplasma sp. 1654_15]|uniref:ZIP family metal transporter n=1 Tax=Mycoplasma sp. 1654_15 TaxID=2725994 RepID=UPI001449C0DA|nr:ZIP family metal transporter [Mycoplasma sp. 1654_15]QJB70995.1 ZIP family metal transporter [Mycoplasma sp. 1654_15]
MVLLVALVKPKIKQITNTYLYSLSAGLLLIVATAGLLREAYENAENFAFQQFWATSNTQWIKYSQLWVAILVGSGAILGVCTIFIVRFFFVKHFKKDTHSNHHEHDHDDHIINFKDIDNPRAAWLAIILLLSHRTIDGFILGSIVSKISQGQRLNYGLIITFVAHILIEILIIYYRQIQYGQKVRKAVIYNLLTTIILIPIITIGAFVYRFLNQAGWILPIVNASGGAILSFVVVVELVPEFIHLRSGAKKQWYITLIWFVSGIIIASILLSFHAHVSNAPTTQLKLPS